MFLRMWFELRLFSSDIQFSQYRQSHQACGWRVSVSNSIWGHLLTVSLSGLDLAISYFRG
jgi:hypothetical protein